MGDRKWFYAFVNTVLSKKKSKLSKAKSPSEKWQMYFSTLRMSKTFAGKFCCLSQCGGESKNHESNFVRIETE